MNRTKYALLAVSFWLALAFVVSCSSDSNDDGSNDNGSYSSGGNLSSVNGGSSSSFGSSSSCGGSSSSADDDSSSSNDSDIENSSSSEGSSSSANEGSSSSNNNGSSSSSSEDIQSGISYGILSYGGKDYKTVQIGKQTWMAENLNYNAVGSKCVGSEGDSGTLLDEGGRCDTYGRLYDWATAMKINASYNSSLWAGSDVKHQGICPSGWHIPSDADWNELINFAEENPTDCPDTYCPWAGKHLRAKDGWNERSCDGCGNGVDTYGFSALPGGYGLSTSTSGIFYNVGLSGYWWSSSELNANVARAWDMYYGFSFVSSNLLNKSILYSVRCLED